MPFLFLLFWSLLFVLFAKSKSSVIASTLTSQIFNRHFKKVDGQKRQKKNKQSTSCQLNVRFACRFTYLTAHSPLFMLLLPLCLFLECVMCSGGRGRQYPLHAVSSRHVSDGNVRHRQTWWRLTAAYSSVCSRGWIGGSCHRAPNTVILLRIFWEPSVSHGVEERERGVKKPEREREMMFCVPLHHRGRLFPPHHCSPGNLGLPIKRDHTANMKYTLCVERLIKYWLQTYMNLPHQIEAPVGGLPLIRCVWYGNESRKAAGAAAHYTYPMLLIYLFCCHVVSAHCEVSVQPRMKLHLHILRGGMLEFLQQNSHF